MSLDLAKIADFGDASYLLDQATTASDGHVLIPHDDVVKVLQQAVQNEEKAERLRAIQALRYARRRKEGLVDWRFQTAAIARKDLIAWARRQVQKYSKQI